MHKSLKLFSGTIIVITVALALAYAWRWIEMGFAGSAHYTEQDKREYNFYTPDLLKNMPRISTQYSFEFANVTGPAAHVYVVKFYATKDSNKIEEYLTSVGYKRNKCDFESVCWRKTDPQESVYIDTLNGEETLVVQVVYNYS